MNSNYLPRIAKRALLPVISALTACFLLSNSPILAAPPVDVLTYQVDPGNNGVNRNETYLTPGSITPTTFGKLYTIPLDGQVFTQPLIKTNVRIKVGSNRGTHNVVFVGTEHDSVYAIDADSGVVLWQDSFIDPEDGVTTVPAHEIESDPNIAREIGITGTPVIDRRNNTLYVSAMTREIDAGQLHYIQRLHAIDIETGEDRLGSPTLVADTAYNNGQYTYYSGPSVAGTGDGSVNGRIVFNAMRENQRPAVEIVNGIIYLAYASQNDIGPYHGWILGFRESNLQLIAVFNDTPNGGLGGIWGAAAKPAVDDDGDLYFSTGNGSFDSTLNSLGKPDRGDYGNSIVKLAVDPTTTQSNPGPNGWGLKVVDYFTPSDFQYQNDRDGDIGSGGICLLPADMGSPQHPHLLITGGKDYRLYLLDRDNMTGFHADHDYVVQEENGVIHRLFSCPIPFDGFVYFATDSDPLMQFSVQNAVASDPPTAKSDNSFGFPGATAFVSANGSSNAILWALDRNTNALYAYDVANYPKRLYSSNDATEDALGIAVRFTIPTVANGKVYAGTDNSLVCYGLLPIGRSPFELHAVVPPSVTPPLTATNANGVVKGAEIDLTWTNNATNATSYVILRKTGSAGTYITLAVLPGNSTSYHDTDDIQPHMDYEYHIIARNSAGSSDFAGFLAQAP